jgi:hypothetical protein
MKPIATTTAGLVPRRTLDWSRVGSEVVIIDRSAGELIRLDAVGAFIWARLDGTRTREDLAQKICERFAVEAHVAERDLRQFLSRLVSLGLLETATEAAGTDGRT